MWQKIGVVALAMTISVPALAAKPDAWITTKTKLALWTTGGISSTDVDVDTVAGVVTLHGKVETAAERAAAEREAGKIDGVKTVRNLLQVVPKSREKAVARTDKQIKDAVEDGLRARGLRDIDVKSVNAGVVLLGGKADDLGEQVRAVRVAYGTDGVKRVASEMQGADRAFSDDLDAPVTTAGKPGVKQRAHDGWLTTEVKMKLVGDDRVPAMDVNVDTRDGVVTLFGNVPSEASKRAAEADAKKVGGVERVINELSIVPSSQKAAMKAEDKDLEKQVKQAMAAREDMKDVDVAVSAGVVRLTGTVRTRLDKLEASIVSRSTSGVRSVSNDLTVKSKKD